MITDINPNPDEFTDQVLATEPESNTNDPLAPETPKEDVVNPDDSNINIIKTDNGSYTIKLPNIIYKGQVGKMITNTLNKIFKTDNEKKFEEKISFDVPDYRNETTVTKESYLYAINLKTVNEQGLNILLDDLLRLKKNSDKVVGFIDPDDCPKGSIDLVIECLKENDIDIYFNLEAALESFDD